MTRAGRFREFITIQRRTPVDDAKWGQNGETWATHAQVWAEVLPTGGAENFNEGAETQAGFTVRTRWFADLTTKDRVVFRGRTLDIVSLEDFESRRQEWLMTVTEHPAVS